MILRTTACSCNAGAKRTLNHPVFIGLLLSASRGNPIPALHKQCDVSGNFIKSILFVLVLFASCRHKQPTSISDNPLIRQDTIRLNQKVLIQNTFGDRLHSVVHSANDTIVKYKGYYFKAEYLDIDADGYTDIRAFCISSTPNECENYFYDKVTGTYRLIEQSGLDITLLPGTDMFYSYNSIGCSDLSWESHLSRIENWTEVNVGRMQVNGCGEANDKIEVFKVKNNIERPFQQLAIKIFDDSEERNKWAFLREYWKTNWKHF